MNMSNLSLLEILHQDILGQIVNKFLNAETVFGLILCCKRLNSRLLSPPSIITCLHFARSYFIQNHTLRGLGCILKRGSFPSKLENLMSLRYESSYENEDDPTIPHSTQIEWNLPPKSITSLSLHFYIPGYLSSHAAAFNVLQLLPNFKNLSITDYAENELDLSHLKWPETVSSLEIESPGIGDVLYNHLPPKLTKLHLRCSNFFKNITLLPLTVTDFCVSAYIDGNIIEFPQNWTSLHLKSLQVQLRRNQDTLYPPLQLLGLHHLPNTLTSLHLAHPSVDFIEDSESLSIPFFPHLQHLSLHEFQSLLVFNEQYFNRTSSSNHSLTSLLLEQSTVPNTLPSSITKLQVVRTRSTLPSHLHPCLPPQLQHLVWITLDSKLPPLPQNFTYLQCHPRSVLQENGSLMEFPKSLKHINIYDQDRWTFGAITWKQLALDFPESIKSIQVYSIVIDTASVTMLAKVMNDHGVLEFLPENHSWKKEIGSLLVGNRSIFYTTVSFNISTEWPALLPRNLTNLEIAQDSASWGDKELEHLPPSLKRVAILQSENFSDSGLKYLPPSIEVALFPSSTKFSIKLFDIVPKSLTNLTVKCLSLTNDLIHFMDWENFDGTLNLAQMISIGENILEQKSSNVTVDIRSEKCRWLDSIDDGIGVLIRENPAITNISLPGYHLSNEFLLHLPPNLVQLELEKNYLITQEGFLNLQRSPGVETLEILKLPSDQTIERIHLIPFIPPKLQLLVLSKWRCGGGKLEKMRKQLEKSSKSQIQ